MKAGGLKAINGNKMDRRTGRDGKVGRNRELESLEFLDSLEGWRHECLDGTEGFMLRVVWKASSNQ